jgi:hypothetical protein
MPGLDRTTGLVRPHAHNHTADIRSAHLPVDKPGMEQHEGHLRVTAVAVSDAARDPDRERIVVDCFLGSNWVLTAHSAEIAVLDDFREIAEGKGVNAG